MNASLFDIEQQLKTAVLQYATLAQAIAHQTQPDPSLERDYQTALGTLIRLQAVQSSRLFEQEAADYHLLVEENHVYASALRKALDELNIHLAHEVARKLDQSYRRAQGSFEAATAYLKDYVRAIYQQAYNACLNDSGDVNKAEKAGLITACRTFEGYVKSLVMPVNSNDVTKEWAVAEDATDKAARQAIALQLSQ